MLLWVSLSSGSVPGKSVTQEASKGKSLAVAAWSGVGPEPTRKVSVMTNSQVNSSLALQPLQVYMVREDPKLWIWRQQRGQRKVNLALGSDAQQLFLQRPAPALSLLCSKHLKAWVSLVPFWCLPLVSARDLCATYGSCLYQIYHRLVTPILHTWQKVWFCEVLNILNSYSCKSKA